MTVKIWMFEATDPGKLAQQLFLWIAAPSALFLCFLIGPFQAADESAHYLRALAIADGYILPVNSPPTAVKPAAGAYVDANAARLALGRTNLGGTSGRYSLAEMAQASQLHSTREKMFAEHSNTAIYPPPLYVASASAIAVARSADLPVLWWLYLGRLANALLGIIIIQAALKRSGDAGLSLFVAATLPVTLFQISTVSADALLLPLIIAFSVLLHRIFRKVAKSWKSDIALATTALFIAVGKIAYLPLIVLPSLATWLAGEKRLSKRLIFFSVASLVMTLLWLLWAILVQNQVFSIRPNVEIDAKAQLGWIIAHPWSSTLVFLRSMAQSVPKLAIGSVGRWLGWGDLIMPSWLTYLLPFWLLASGFPTNVTVENDNKRILLTFLISGICFIATFVLIYLQYNQVGASEIVGVQGRYFTPLAILCLTALPRFQVSPRIMNRVWIFAAIVALVNAAATVIYAQERYWTLA